MSGTAPLAMRIEPQLSANALEVLSARYLVKDDRGRSVETLAKMFAPPPDGICSPKCPQCSPDFRQNDA